MVVAVEYISKEESADAETATHGVTGILAVQGRAGELEGAARLLDDADARVCALVRPLAECVAKDAADERRPQRNARAGQQVSAGEDAWPERRRPKIKTACRRLHAVENWVKIQ